MINMNAMRNDSIQEPLSPTTDRKFRQGSLSPKEFQAQLWKEKRVVHPENVFKILWDIFQGVLIFWSVITVPLRLAFDIEATGAWLIANWIIDTFFLIDIILNFIQHILMGGRTYNRLFGNCEELLENMV